jgi:SAM-dependent methyltransferase
MPFNRIAAAYDLLSPPGERLAREGAALAAWAGSARRVLELACGTGAHAAFLAGSAKRKVVACDLSRSMIAQAKGKHTHRGLRFAVADMRQPPAGPFDRAMILGNSLNLLPDRAAVAVCLAAVRAVLAPGGSFLLQVINPDNERHRQPRLTVRSGAVEGRELAAVKSLSPHGDRHLLSLSSFTHGANGVWESASETSVLLDLRHDELDLLLAEAGFPTRRWRGGMDGSAFDPVASPDLVVEAVVP